MSLRKRILSLLLTIVIVLGLLPLSVMAVDADLPFNDVATTDWFYDGVKFAYDNGLMVGTSSTTFAPATTTTRAMVVTILYRLDGSPVVTTSGTFTDVAANSWYTKPIEWAAANGIVSGYGNRLFGPNDTITREQMATIMYRYSGYKGYDVSQQSNLSKFFDVGEVSSWAKTPMAWANVEGLITGTTSTTLSPKGNATRAQVAVILNRFCENVVFDTSDNSSSMTTDQSVNQAYSIYENLYIQTGAIEKKYIDDNGYVESDEVNSLLLEVNEYAASLYRDGIISDYAYEDGDTCVYMQIDGWLGYLFAPSIEDTLSGSTSESVEIFTYEPFAYEAGTNIGYIMNGLKGPDDAAKTIISSFGEAFHFNSNYDNADVSLDTLTRLKPNSIIMWNGHGGYNKKFGPMLSLGSPKKQGNLVINNMTTSQHLYKDGSLMLINDYCCVTPIYFEKHMVDGALDGSLIYLNACNSFTDSRLAQSLWDKGARCIVGNSTTIWTPYGIAMMYDFFIGLTKKSSDGNYNSVSEALAFAKSEEGEHDPIQGGQVLVAYKDDFTLLDMFNASDDNLDSQSKINYYEFFDAGADTWEEAQAYCESLGGHLATLTSQEENDYVYQQMVDVGYKSAYFGLTDTDTEGTWTWITGEPLSYQNWHKGEPNAENQNEDYAMFYYKYSDGTWNDGDFGKKTVSSGKVFICEWDTEAAYQSYCSTKERQHTYEVFDLNLSWSAAKAYCESIGGHLATITSQAEQDSIAEILQSGSQKAYWLGGTDYAEEGKWVWITGESWSFTNWGSGQPDNHADLNGSDEHYLTIVRSGAKWNDLQHDGDPSPDGVPGFICEWE